MEYLIFSEKIDLKKDSEPFIFRGIKTKFGAKTNIFQQILFTYCIHRNTPLNT